jgi:YYY domain-containing protein
MGDSLLWWLGLTVVGWAAFPLAFLFFSWLPDRGFAFTRVFGMVLLSYALWVGGLAHEIPVVGALALPFHRITIVALIVLMAVVGLALVRRRPEMRGFFRERWGYVLAVEGLFAAALAGGLWLRSFTPEIAFGEKLADLAFINGMLQSDYFPPKDPWLSGGEIHWYYFGHLNVATLTKLLDIPSRITFNLAAVSMAALGAIGVFGLIYNLIVGQAGVRRAFVFGLVAVVFLIFLTNLVGLFEMMAAHGVGSKGLYGLIGVTGLDGPRETDRWYPTEWWWIGRAVTIAPRDLREFPFFSFLTGDLHAHMMAIPFNFLALGALLNLWRSDLKLDGGFPRAHPVLFVVIAVVIGAVGFVELWDLPALLFLLAVVAFALNYRQQRALNLRVAIDTAAFALPIGLLAGLTFLPYYLGLKSISEGLQPIEVNHLQVGPIETAVTRPHHYIYAWLPFTWVMLGFAIVMVRISARRGGGGSEGRQREWLPWLAASLGVLPLLLWCSMVFVKRGPVGFADEVWARDASWITAAIMVGLITAAALAFLRLATSDQEDDERRTGALFVLSVSATAFLLLWGAEIFWVEDPIGTRFNTLFRLGYQAWLLLSVTMAYGLYAVLSRWEVRLPSAGALAKAGWATLAVLIIGAALIYPAPATFWRSNNFDNPQSLDGFVLAKRFNPDDDAAIGWLAANAEGSPIILEAVGDDYRDDQGRVSARTGYQTVLSWPGHQERWRGGPESFAGRAEDVEMFYTTDDVARAADVLRRYEIDYVYVGKFEREKYGEAGLPKLDGFLDVAFENESVKIYRVPDGLEGRVEER